MTASADPARGFEPGMPARDEDLRLARLHLRTGALTMARAEYESLVATGPLGPDDLVDLAEVRWRTGDLAGAGDAAAAHLELGGGSGRALGIAAEAAAAIGRTVEAERLAARAEQRLDVAVADFFAGMPMSGVWPSGPGPAGAAPVPNQLSETESPAAPPPMPVARETAPIAPDAATATPGPAPATDELAPVAPSAPVALVELDAGCRALGEGDFAAAVVHLAVVLRHAPDLASDVLDAIDARSGPSFDIVRGDAYRLMGLEADAQASYALASAALAAPDAASGPSTPEDPEDADASDAPDPGAVR